MIELKEIIETLEETQKALTIYSNEILPRNEEEINFLHVFRELSTENKIRIAAKIEGMLEAQTYVHMTKK